MLHRCGVLQRTFYLKVPMALWLVHVSLPSLVPIWLCCWAFAYATVVLLWDGVLPEGSVCLTKSPHIGILFLLIIENLTAQQRSNHPVVAPLRSQDVFTQAASAQSVTRWVAMHLRLPRFKPNPHRTRDAQRDASKWDLLT